nr:unnamed protein product [Digitaria exilis]
MRTIILLLFVVGVIAIYLTSTPTTTATPVDITDPDIQDLGRWAVTEHVKKANDGIKFKSVVSADQTNGADFGQYYGLVIDALDGHGKDGKYKAQVRFRDFGNDRFFHWKTTGPPDHHQWSRGGRLRRRSPSLRAVPPAASHRPRGGQPPCARALPDGYELEVVGAGACGLDAKARSSALPVFMWESKQAGGGRGGAARRAACGVPGEMEDGELGRVLPVCRHVFHVECIGTWLGVSLTCPVCRMAAATANVAVASGEVEPRGGEC